MTSAPTVSGAPMRTLIRSVALPSEHGAWGFLIEPLLLGLLVAGTGQGALLALACFGIFLIHQPLKLAVKDHLKRRRVERTRWAERFALLYGLMALLPSLILLAAGDLVFLLPVALAVPFAVLQLLYDARNQSRALIPEIAGSIALGSSASAIALLGAWSWVPALGLWLIVTSRAIPSILYVRARLRLEHGRDFQGAPVWFSHAIALFIVAGAVYQGYLPVLAAFAMLILWARSILGLSTYRQGRRAAVIGMQEMLYGLLLVILSALGYTLRL